VFRNWKCNIDHPCRQLHVLIDKGCLQGPCLAKAEKVAIMIRHRILAAVLRSFAPPFKKADVLLVVRFIVSRLQFAQVLQIAKRHRIGVDANAGAPERDLLRHVSRFEEAELRRFLLELSLLDSAYRLPGKDAEDVLLSAAKRCRIDSEKIEKEVAQKFSATVPVNGQMVRRHTDD
jgi:hypothetical protein